MKKKSADKEKECKMKLLVEGKTTTEAEDNARQKREVIRCELDGMCGRTKNMLNLTA
jgi:hypothetical protein